MSVKITDIFSWALCLRLVLCKLKFPTQFNASFVELEFSIPLLTLRILPHQLFISTDGKSQNCFTAFKLHISRHSITQKSFITKHNPKIHIWSTVQLYTMYTLDIHKNLKWNLNMFKSCKYFNTCRFKKNIV